MLDPKDFDDLSSDIDKLFKSVEGIRQLEVEVHVQQQKYAKEFQMRRKQLKNLRAEVKTPESKKRYEELDQKLRQLEKARMVKNPLPLWLYLGSANFYLPGGHRISYKVEYEKTKVICVIIHILISLLQLLLNYAPLDAISNFFLLYHYSTMTVREHILVVNGSNIRPWWIFHHYLSIVLAATLLVWPNGPTYQTIRPTIVYFGLYMAVVQLMQYRNQVSRLYTLRALSRVDPMETTTDAENLHLTTSLIILLPFLFFGHGFQFFMSFRFYKLAVLTLFSEWQVILLSGLFACIASGNLIMTLITVYRKAKAPRQVRPAGKKSE